MGEPAGEGGGLAGSRASQHQHRAFGGQHGLSLRRIEAADIGRIILVRYIDDIGHE